MEIEDAVVHVRVDDDLLRTLTCGICKELMEKPAWIRECGHTFCRGCVDDFLKVSQSQNCPKCRLPFDKDSLVACYHLVEILDRIGRRCGLCDREYVGARESHAVTCSAAQVCQDCGRRHLDPIAHRESCPQLVKCCGRFFPKTHDSLPHGSNTELEAHRSEDSTCPRRWKRCPNCDLWVRTPEFLTHEWKSCAWTCGLCRGALFRSEGDTREQVMELHRSVCPEERVCCARCPSGMKFRRRTTSRHDRHFHGDAVPTKAVQLYHVEEENDDEVTEGDTKVVVDGILGWETVALLFGMFASKCTEQNLEIDVVLDKSSWKDGTRSSTEYGYRNVTACLPEEMSFVPDHEHRSSLPSIGNFQSSARVGLSIDSDALPCGAPKLKASFEAGVDARYRLRGTVVEDLVESLCLAEVEFAFPGGQILRPNPTTRLHLRINFDQPGTLKQFRLAIRDACDAIFSVE